MSIKAKGFLLGVFFGYVLFFVCGAMVGGSNRPICIDCVQEYGFPFTSFESGGFVTQSNIRWSGLLGNFLIASVFSIAVGRLSYLWVTKWRYKSKKNVRS